jgi:hypothetical protein
MPKDPKDYPIVLSRSLAEEMTGIDVRELDNLRKKGLVRCFKTLGGQYRFHKLSLIQYIESKSNYFTQINAEQVQQER